VELTAAGEVFLAGAHKALAALDRAATDALRTSRAVTGVLRVGFCPGAALELTEVIFSEFQDRYPEVELEPHEYPLSDPSAGLGDGSSDVAFVRLPLGSDGLDNEPLFTEPVVVAVSSGHRLAGRDSVMASELLDEPMTLSSGGHDPTYRSFWLLEGFRDGKPPPKIVETSSVTEEVALVSTGVAIAVTAAAAVRFVPHPSIRFLPITDAPGSTVAVSWRPEEAGPLVERFREVAAVVRDREADLVRRLERPELTHNHNG